MPFRLVYPNHQMDSQPAVLQDMIAIARKLARAFCFVRIDLYVIGHKVYVGELTHLPENGKGRFYPKQADFQLSSLFTGKMLKDLGFEVAQR